MHGDKLVIPIWFVVGMHCLPFQGLVVDVRFALSIDLLRGHAVLEVSFYLLSLF